jgi:predicted RNase H-like HicB family nuclease
MESKEGYAASCAVLRGCHSQGATKEEALAKITDALREWLAAEDDEIQDLNVIEEVVTV